jgi:hypothetical protein
MGKDFKYLLPFGSYISIRDDHDSVNSYNMRVNGIITMTKNSCLVPIILVVKVGCSVNIAYFTGIKIIINSYSNEHNDWHYNHSPQACRLPP